jgi:hypothetical protein
MALYQRRLPAVVEARAAGAAAPPGAHTSAARGCSNVPPFAGGCVGRTVSAC